MCIMGICWVVGLQLLGLMSAEKYHSLPVLCLWRPLLKEACTTELAVSSRSISSLCIVPVQCIARTFTSEWKLVSGLLIMSVPFAYGRLFFSFILMQTLLHLKCFCCMFAQIILTDPNHNGSLSEELDLRLLLHCRTLFNINYITKDAHRHNCAYIHEYICTCVPLRSYIRMCIIFMNICDCLHSWCMNSFSDFWSHRIFSQTQPRNSSTRHLFCRYCCFLFTDRLLWVNHSVDWSLHSKQGLVAQFICLAGWMSVCPSMYILLVFFQCLSLCSPLSLCFSSSVSLCLSFGWYVVVLGN